MAQMRFQPPVVSFRGSMGAITFATKRTRAVVRANVRRPRRASERELKRIIPWERSMRAWDALSVAQRETWIAAAAAALDPPEGFNPREITGHQLHTSSYVARSQAGASIVTNADEDAWIRVDPVGMWFEPNLAAQTVTIRALEFDFPAGGPDPRGITYMREPIRRTRHDADRRSSFLATWDWDSGVPGFNRPAIVQPSPFPMLPAQRFAVANRACTALGVVSYRRWVEVLTPPENHATAAYIRPFFFGLKSPSVTVDPGPVITIVTSIGEFPESHTRDFSSPSGQTVEDVLDWIDLTVGWDVLRRDASLNDRPASAIEPFGRSVVTINWQPRALFVALP